MLTISQVKIGQYLELDGQPYEVLRAQHTKPGKGHAILKLKIQNLATGTVLEKTFQGQERLAEADISTTKAQYLYHDDDSYYFMDQETYEQFSLPARQLGIKAQYLVEGTVVEILNHNDLPINTSLPIKIDLKVISSPPGVKGNTADGGTKEVITETGLKVSVPLFIKEGDVIRVNTTEGKYVARA